MTWPLEGSREIDEGIIISEPMDWCKSTCAIVPYRLYAFQRDAMDLAYNVRQTSDPTHVRESIVLQSFGDEPGSGGGVISGTHLAECTPKTWSESVFADGRNVVRHDDEWWMNHKNTWGKLYYVKDTSNLTPSPPQAIDPKMLPADADKYQALVFPPGVTAPPSSTAPATGAGAAAAESAAPATESWLWRALPWVGRVGGAALAGVTFYFGSTKPLNGNENELERQKQYQKPKTTTKTKPKPLPVPIPPGTGSRTSGKCCIAPYNVNAPYNPVKPERGGKNGCAICIKGVATDAHHGMVDYPFRTGTTWESAHRAPGAPTYADALTICIPKDDHKAAHDNFEKDLSSHVKNGVVSFGDVKNAAFDSIDKLNSVSAACKAAYKAALEGQYGLPSNMLLRGNESPLPEKDSATLGTLQKSWGW